MRLKAEAGAGAVVLAGATGDRTVEEVAVVELDAGLLGWDFQHSATSRA